LIIVSTFSCSNSSSRLNKMHCAKQPNLATPLLSGTSNLDLIKKQGGIYKTSYEFWVTF